MVDQERLDAAVREGLYTTALGMSLNSLVSVSPIQAARLCLKRGLLPKGRIVGHILDAWHGRPSTVP